ncbi:MAG: hypothetical protein WBQ00_04235, partial [Terriglobales bacterium]
GRDLSSDPSCALAFEGNIKTAVIKIANDRRAGFNERDMVPEKNPERKCTLSLVWTQAVLGVGLSSGTGGGAGRQDDLIRVF